MKKFDEWVESKDEFGIGHKKSCLIFLNIRQL